MSPQETQIQSLIDDLRTKLLVMSAKVQQALDDAVYAMQYRHIPHAITVMDGDADIDAMENAIDEACLNILVRTQPVASDLRFIMTAIRMVQDLERIGDEATTIAERAMLMDDTLPPRIATELEALTAHAQESLRSSITAFRDMENLSGTQLYHLFHQEDETPLRITRIYRDMMESVQQGQLGSWASMHIIFIVRALERISRRAENIAEHIYFVLKGISAKHRHIDGE